MQALFTICSNNYLAYATTLFKSIRQHSPSARFFLFLCDEKKENINYDTVADEVIELKNIEPKFLELAAKFNIIELNTSLKPMAFEYLFTSGLATQVIYLDPDIKTFDSIDFLFEGLNRHNILLSPHILSPIPFDGKTPQENHFLNFGTFNLGFLGLRKCGVGMQFLDWWKNHTYYRGYIDVYKGIFVDQLPINLAPLFFEGTYIIRDPGLNVAPWNLHERKLSVCDKGFLVNETHPLIFYHFSSFRINDLELPLAQYDRFHLAEIPVLKNIYEEYQNDLYENHAEEYQKIDYAYQYLRMAEKRKIRIEKWKNKLSAGLISKAKKK